MISVSSVFLLLPLFKTIAAVLKQWLLVRVMLSNVVEYYKPKVIKFEILYDNIMLLLYELNFSFTYKKKKN